MKLGGPWEVLKYHSSEYQKSNFIHLLYIKTMALPLTIIAIFLIFIFILAKFSASSKKNNLYLYLFQWVFLPDFEMRSKMTLPPRAQVDYRAACFCHRNLIDIGYVCSVCLSSKDFSKTYKDRMYDTDYILIA